MALPTDSDWLAPAGTNRSAATHAVVELYERAGMAEPTVEWFSSPLAAMRQLPYLVSQVEHTRRRSYGRGVIGGPQPCLCSDCLGSSVVDRVVPTDGTSVVDPEVESTARHIAETVRRAAGRLRQKVGDDLARHDGISSAPNLLHIDDRPTATWLPENQWIASARILGCSETPAAGVPPDAVLAGSAGWWWLNHGVAVLSDRPLAVHLDEAQHLHRTEGPAVVYEDGFSANVIDGILLPDWYFEKGAVTVERIEAEPNMEVRRLLIDRIGGERYMAEAGGLLVHEDQTGQLWSITRDIHGWLRSDIRLVRVVDATPQADGTHRAYWLHVPPFLNTARAAVAWTFGLKADQYFPQVET